MSAPGGELCGRTIGEFVLREQIGEGAFGAVYRCEQLRLGREAVIKVLHGRYRASPVMVERFLREARLASRLDHPYAAHVYASGVEQEDGLLWIAMEMVHGTPLDRWLRDRGPLPLALLVPFFEHIAEVVHTAHDAGIVHRDLKPSNVMVIERAGRLLPKLLDLGIAKQLTGEPTAGAPHAPHAAQSLDATEPVEQPGDATWPADQVPAADAHAGPALTGAGAAIGSPAYMAPEQWDGDAVGPPSDLYALGVLAYEALAGRRPFAAPTAAELAELHLNERVPPLGTGFAPALDRFFERALAKQPRDRPPTALALAAELRFASGLDELPVEWIADAPSAIAAAAELPCPYPGMRAYSADIAARFHGREAEVEDVLGRLGAGARELYVIGPSGSGKSSLVAAGVLPRLTRGAAGLGTFLVRSLRPGEHPAARLAEVLEADLTAPAAAVAALLALAAPGAALLLVVDQLEELFTLASEPERATFLAALRALRAEPRCVLMFTLRADFFGAFMESPLWSDLQGRVARIEVAPLRGQALREAIERPARDLGVTFEPELVERLLADAASEPGILPLLQETLIQLWDRRQLRMLTLADYRALGEGGRSGLAVAIARRADATLRALTRAQEAIARRILLRLVSFGEGRSDTRRQQPLSALRAVDDEAADFDAVVRRLVGDRLLAIDGEGESDGDGDGDGDARVDLAHEVMIAAWPTLADWIRTRRGDEQHRRQLEAAAALWTERGRGAGGLLDPIELAEAQAWRTTASARDLGESPEVAALIAASKATHERQRKRRLAALWGVIGALSAFAVIVATLAFMERRQADQAEDSRRQAEDSRRQGQRLLALSYQEAGRQLLLDGHPLKALSYLVAARRAGEGGPPLRMLFWAATRNLPRTSLQHRQPVTSAALSPDGARVVTASADGTARVWDASTGKPLSPPLQHGGTVNSAAFSPDGARAVTASADSTARIWDASTGAPLTRSLEHQGSVLRAAFSPDGVRVVTASRDGTARVWDASTGNPLLWPLAHRGGLNGAAFSPDGKSIVTASDDRTAQVWDTSAGTPRGSPLQHRGAVLSAAFNPDGTRVVTASGDNTARVWDASTGKPLSPPLGHQGGVYSAAFSPDGTRVVTASWDTTARLWETSTSKPLFPRLEHQGSVRGAVFGPGGTRVVTVSDNTARIWEAATAEPASRPVEPWRSVEIALGPDGARVIAVSGQIARVWESSTGKPLSPPLQHRGAVTGAAFSPDGARVITASDDHTAQIWDVSTGQPLGPPLEHRSPVVSAAFSPDGTRVVTASTGGRAANTSGDSSARIWDAATGKPLGPRLEHEGALASAAFGPDGTRVVTANADGSARIWDAATGKLLLAPLEHRSAVTGAAFGPDGARVITASADGTARVWDAGTGKLLSPPLEHQGSVTSVGFGPDGTRVVTASVDGTARVWDAASGKPLSLALEHRDGVSSAAFSRDGSRIITASGGHVQVWEVPLDDGTLARWAELEERSPYMLGEGVLVPRPARASSLGR